MSCEVFFSNRQSVIVSVNLFREIHIAACYPERESSGLL